MKTILICGSRAWTNEQAIRNQIEIYRPLVIVNGGARGADTMAQNIALQLGITTKQYLPDWKLYGRSAGIKRNIIMLDESRPDEVWAFQVNNSPGTSHMIKYATRKGCKVKVFHA